MIKAELDDETYIFKVDHYGNMIEGDLFGLKIIREPKDQALTLDAKNI